MSDVRVIYVTGMPSGGTSCCAATLVQNGYYSGRLIGNYERGDARDIFRWRSLWQVRSGKEGKPIEPEEYFGRIRAEAAAAGVKRAVVKYPWMPLWEPERLRGCDVILVGRNVERNAASIERRFPHIKKRARAIARIGQRRIDALSRDYGWPVWRFGAEGCHAQLEEIVGHELPVVVYKERKR